ncbi:MAG: hypothetical protein EXR91_07385 [Gemmatimonadetes bacterium]|nr:hypothetical protein [Gemmatimonadota bacterium]
MTIPTAFSAAVADRYRIERELGQGGVFAPDSRILVMMGSPEVSADRIHVITGFTSRLNRLAPAN